MVKIKLLGFLLLGFLFCQSSFAQQGFRENGVADERDDYFAFINAHVYQNFQLAIDSCTLIIKKGKIVSIGKKLAAPKDAIVVDLHNKYIYPGFIDMLSSVGISELKSPDKPQRSGGRQLESSRPGAFGWNDALHTDFNAVENFTNNPEKNKTLRSWGFCAINTHKADGISRGTSSLVALGDQKENLLIIKEKAAHILSFSKGTSTQSYPSSLMGIIALLRQTYMDADWYAKEGFKEQTNLSLSSWNDVQKYPQIFVSGDKLNDLRAAKIAKEFDKKYIIKGGGNEYQQIEEIKKQGFQLILPVNFPEAYELDDPNIADRISLSDMKHWELAPSNPKIVAENGIEFALTSDGLEDGILFKKKIVESVERGLSKEYALKSLTYNPAQWLKAYDQIGSLDPGKLANFIITDTDYFDKKSIVLENWVLGKALKFSEISSFVKYGNYQLVVGEKDTMLLIFEKDASKIKAYITGKDTSKTAVNTVINENILNLSFQANKKDKEFIRLAGSVYGDEILGAGFDKDGNRINFKAVYQSPTSNPKELAKVDSAKTELPQVLTVFPWSGYGSTTIPTQKTYLIKNATIWTNEKEGILEGYDLLLKDGKIAKLGKKLSDPTAIEIDASGKQITAGIIDEHSHIAIQGGVNECTHAVTAEVRIGDVLNCDDINIYRQLAGGVTASQLLHGSCNPVGGQSAIIKLRWGFSPEKMKIENAPNFIKFALGENVKSSFTISNNRFPDTRMGVEQVYADAFTRAQEYLNAKNDPIKAKSLRNDLQMEAMVEILTSKRFITCHSYIQSEINMLMHVATQFGFKVNTFTHILEGYKIADKIKAHGAGVSTFSDWWAYKYEVIDAIPYNGAIMHDMGLVTAFNSDDPEMARHLNQEAAKAIKYGGVSPEEALKFVTLNPAKLLHLDNTMGSIKVRKDADVVVWSDNPLSIYAKAELTFIDGIKFFDRNEMNQNYLEIQKERNRLIQKMIAIKKSGGKTEKFTSPKKIIYHCDTINEEESSESINLK